LALLFKKMTKYPFLFFVGLWLCSCANPEVWISVDAGEYDRIAIPITVSLNQPLDIQKNYSLIEPRSDRAYAVEIMDEQTIVFFLDSMHAGEHLKLKLVQKSSNNPIEHGIDITENKDVLKVSQAGKEVFSYQLSLAFPPQGEHPLYARNGFIHPIKSPNGSVLTDDFPAGHLHQHAVYNAWTNTRFKGKKIDFWNQLDSLGTITHKALHQVKVGEVIGQITTSLSHIGFGEGELLEETWDIRIYPTSTFFLFDIYSTQTNTSNDTLFLDKYIYGGMALRGSKEWNPDDSLHFAQAWKVASDLGFTLENVNHTKARWISVSGELSGKEAGVTVFGFPDNFRYPQTVRVHPKMPYWVFSPVVEEGFFIAPGETYTSKFRYFVHDGPADFTHIERLHQNLLSPVKIQVYE
jgi:hypothetical protein